MLFFKFESSRKDGAERVEVLVLSPACSTLEISKVSVEISKVHTSHKITKINSGFQAIYEISRSVPEIRTHGDVLHTFTVLLLLTIQFFVERRNC